MPTAVDLDHVAVAAESAWDLVEVYAGQLGGRLAGGDYVPGFHFCQFTFANAMRVELLQPHAVHESDFLQRFLDRSGPGPHHLTFKVPDIEAKIDEMRAAGHAVVSINLENPNWREAFLHPKQTHGIVVQMAQPGEDGLPGPADDEEPLPPGRLGPTASFVRIEHLVADLPSAVELFTGPLGGRVIVTDDDADGTTTDIAWPGPGRLRLICPRDRARLDWMGDRPGRLHHLHFEMPDPGRLADVREVAPGRWQRDPADNFGTRLVIDAV